MCPMKCLHNLHVFKQLPTLREEIFAGINFRELDFTDHFAEINFRELSLTKDFVEINFR